MIVIAVLFYLLMVSILFSFVIADYILTSLAVMKMCKKLSIPNSHLAFVPFANSYKLGELSDACYDRARGVKNNFASKLLKLHIIIAILLDVILSLWFILGFAYNSNLGSYEAFTIISVIFTVLVSIATIVFSIIQAVNLYKAFYGIYICFVPNFSVMLLLFSIFLGVPGIYLMIASGKEPMPCVSEQLQQE